MNEFADLGLSDGLQSAVASMGYETPTPIQKAAIPAVLMGRDVLGVAQTGTGKTAGFTLPMIDILAEGQARARMPRSLILSPTRELAAQIAENFEMYGVNHQLSMALLIGGESMKEQEAVLTRGVDVLIATPGRLLDLIDRGSVMPMDVSILVIDEADRMLDMGFIPDIEAIVGRLPARRQTLMFSATMAPPIRKLADKFLNNPKEVKVARAATTASTVETFLVAAKERDKQSTLRAVVQAEQPKSSIVFCNRKRDIASVVETLRRAGQSVAPMHGDLSQPKRMETLEAFRTENLNILVCSDVAARGIDIDHITHVFNYDVPFNAEDYVHRIGRTGRAGRKGRAFMLATPKDQKLVDAIEELTKKKIAAFNLGDAETSSEEDALSATIEAAKAQGVDAKTIKAAQKSFEQHIPAFILRAA